MWSWPTQIVISQPNLCQYLGSYLLELASPLLAFVSKRLSCKTENTIELVKFTRSTQMIPELQYWYQKIIFNLKKFAVLVLKFASLPRGHYELWKLWSWPQQLDIQVRKYFILQEFQVKFWNLQVNFNRAEKNC